jgi:hypothetical protein
MSDQPKNKPGPKQGKMKIQIQLDDDTARGTYSNLQIIQHSDTEFIVDFLFLQPHIPKTKVRSRVIMAPRHAKQLVQILGQHVKHFEEMFGEIKLPSKPGHGGPMGPEGTEYLN